MELEARRFMEGQSKVDVRHVRLDGVKLRDLRQKKFGSQEAMADAAKVAAATVARAEKGYSTLRTNALVFVKVLEVTLEYLLPASPKLPPEGPNFEETYPFEAFIERKIEGFVGRQYILSSIQQFIDTEDCGYCVVEGDPGAGKTSLLAQWVRQTMCFRFFNDRSQGCNRAAQFGNSLYRQLDLRFNLNLAAPKIRDLQDGSALAIALSQLRKQKQYHDKIVIAIDAADEVDLMAQPVGSNVLYLPADVRKSVYFVITLSSRAKVPLITNGPLQIISLLDYPKESQSDIRDYLEEAVSASKVDSWLRRRRTDKRSLVERLVEKGEGNYLYLHYMLAIIKAGGYIDLPLDRLPDGLDDLYHDQWQSLVANGPSDNNLGKILYLLTEIREPVSLNCLAYLTGESEQSVREALDAWSCFVHQELMVDDGREITRYSVDHDSLRGLFHYSKVSADGVDLKTARTSLANRLMEAFTHGFAGCTQELQGYCLRHLPSHLAMVRDPRVEKVLSDPSFLEDKFNSFGSLPLLEDYDLVFRLDMFSALTGPAHEQNDDDASLSLRILREILFLSEQALTTDKTLFRGQLYGRLSPAMTPRLDRIRSQLERSRDPWLRPLRSVLTIPAFVPVVNSTMPHKVDGVHLVLTADGKYAVSAYDSSDDLSLRVWDISTGEELRKLTGHTGNITSLVVAPDGKSVISAATDKTVRIWEVATGKELRTFSGYPEPVGALAVTPDGSRLALLQPDTLIFTDFTTGQEIQKASLRTPLKASSTMLVTPDGGEVVICSNQEMLGYAFQIFDLRSNYLYILSEIHGYSGFAISSNSKWLVTASPGLTIFEYGSWRQVCYFKGSNNASRGALAAITPNCRFAFWSPDNDTAEVRDLRDGRSFRFRLDQDAILTCVAGIDNRTFAVGTEGGGVYFFRLDGDLVSTEIKTTQFVSAAKAAVS